MSEVQSRPSAPRGRGSARGGRGGYASRGGRGGRSYTNGDKPEATPIAETEEDGSVAQLKRSYGSKFTTIKEMFPDWTDEDIVFALNETNGDLETTVDRITDGMHNPPIADDVVLVSKLAAPRKAALLPSIANITSRLDLTMG